MLSTIKNKILIRSAVASVVPITAYSVGYGVAAVAGVATIPYFSAIPWLCIAGVSVIYPLNKIGLTLLFAPIESRLNSKLKIPVNPIIKGNFTPIEEEDLYEIVEVT